MREVLAYGLTEEGRTWAKQFVRTNDNLRYPQFKDEFLPNLSIIDVMMFCSQDMITDLLNQYTLIDGVESAETVNE